MAKFLVEILLSATGEPQARAVFDNVGDSAKKSADSVEAASLKSEASLRRITEAATRLQTQMKDTGKSSAFIADMASLNAKIQEQIKAFQQGGVSLETYNQKQKEAATARQILTAQVRAGVSADSDAGKVIAQQITLYERYQAELTRVKQAQAGVGAHAPTSAPSSLLPSILSSIGSSTGEGRVVTEITAEITRLSSEFSHLAEESGSAGAAISAIVGSFSGLLPIIIAVAAAAVTVGIAWEGFKFLKESVSEGLKFKETIDQLNQTLLSNGSASGLSARQMQEYADSLVVVSGRDDDVILKGELILARFDKLSGDAFPRAIRAALDVAATGKPVSESFALVGKILEGNAKSFQSFTELGIVLTKGQKATLLQMVETGRTAEYQALVFNILSEKVGGLAEKYAHSLAGSIAIAGTAMNEMRKGIASELIPVLEDTINALVASAGGWENIRRVFSEVGHDIGNTLRTVIVVVEYAYHSWEKLNYELAVGVEKAFRSVTDSAIGAAEWVAQAASKLPGAGAEWKNLASTLTSLRNENSRFWENQIAGSQKGAIEEQISIVKIVTAYQEHKQALEADDEVHRHLGSTIDKINAKHKDQISLLHEAAQACQEYSNKLSDLIDKGLRELASQTALAAAAAQGELAYRREQQAQELASAAATAETAVRQAQRAEIEKLTSARDKLREAGDGRDAANVQAAIDASNAGLDATIARTVELAVAKVRQKQATEQNLAIDKDERTLTDQLAQAKAQLTDAYTGTTEATRELGLEQVAERDRLTDLPNKVRNYLISLREEIDATKELATAQKDVTGVFQQANLQISLSQIDSSISSELQKIESQYLTLVNKIGQGSIDKANEVLQKLADKEGLSLDVYIAKIKGSLQAIADATLASSVRGKGKSLFDLYAEERADIERLMFDSTSKVRVTLADGYKAIEEINKKFIDSQLSAWSSALGTLSSEFGGVFTKLDTFVKYLQEFQTLKSDFAVIASGLEALFSLVSGSETLNTSATAANTAAIAANTVALAGSSASSSASSLGSAASAAGGGSSWWSSIMGNPMTGGNGFLGGSGSGAAGAGIFAVVVLAFLDWMKTSGTPKAQSDITIGGPGGIGIGSGWANQGGATSAEARRNIGEALSAALDIINGVKSFIVQLGGAIDLTQKAATTALSIQKHGQGSSTDWIVTTISGQIIHFGKDVQAAEEYAVVQAIKSTPTVGLSPEVQAAIKNSAATKVADFQKDTDIALQAVADRLGDTGAKVTEIFSRRQAEIDAENRLGIAIDATVAARDREIGAIVNSLTGLDTSIFDHLAAIISFNKGVEESISHLTASTQSILGMSIQDAQAYLTQYGDLLNQYHFQKGTPPSPKGGDATPGGWVDAVGKAVDDATAAILAKLAPLKAALDQYAKELGKLPEEITKDQISASIFSDLYKYLQGSAKYEADRLKYAQEMVNLQFALIKVQLEALGAWEQFAGMWQDALDQALKDAAVVPTAHAGGGGGRGSSGPSIADQQATLRDQIAGMVAEAQGAVIKSFFDLATQIATFTKSAHDAKLPAAEFAQAIDLLTQKFRDGLKTQAEGYAGFGTDFTSRLKGVVDFFHEIETLGRPKTGIPNWLEAIFKGTALDKLGVELNSVILQFSGLVDPMAAINTQADTLRQNVLAYGKAAGWTADQIQAALNKTTQGIDYQRSGAINGIMDSLFAYLKDDKDFAQGTHDLKLKELNLQFTIWEAQLKFLNAWDEGTKKIFDAAHAAAEKALDTVQALANFNYADAVAQDRARYTAAGDAAVQAWRQAINQFTQQTQATLTNPAISGLTNQQQFAAAQGNFDALLAKAQGGDTSALSQLDQARQTLLTLGHTMFGGGAGFDALWRKIMGESADLLSHAQQTEASVFQQAMDAATASATANTNTLTTAIYGAANQVASAIYQSFAGLPHYAEGGITLRPHMALVGERGPEAIIPMGRLLSMPTPPHASLAGLDLAGNARVLRYAGGGTGGSGGQTSTDAGAFDRESMRTLAASIDRLAAAQMKTDAHLRTIADATRRTAVSNESMKQGERIKLLIGKRAS